LSKSVDVDADLSGDVGVGLTFENDLGVNIPTSYSIDITHIPKISIGLDDIDVNLAIKEIPSIRAHIPANFALGLSILGYDIACLRLCGEAQVITEPYRPNPCEICGRVHREGSDITHLHRLEAEVPK
jgi:hypothetical protein